VLAELVGPGHPLAVLSGPSVAPEVLRRLPATVVVASEDARLAQAVQRLIGRPYFRVYTNPDVVGVELAVRRRTSSPSRRAYWTACGPATTPRPLCSPAAWWR